MTAIPGEGELLLRGRTQHFCNAVRDLNAQLLSKQRSPLLCYAGSLQGRIETVFLCQIHHDHVLHPSGM